MEKLETLEYQFEYLLSLLGGAERIEQLARETGAFTRSRKIENPLDLLRLLMIWAIAGYSLEETSAIGASEGIADVSDVALLKRFRGCREWIGALLSDLLKVTESTPEGGYRLRLIDATTASKPGSKGVDHRLHVSFSVGGRKIDTAELTTAAGGEKLGRFTFAPNDLVIADRGYAHRPGLAAVVQSGAFYIVRMNWQNLPLQDREDRPFDTLAFLRTLPEAVPSEAAVRMIFPDGTSHDCRLVAIRKSEPAAEAARDKLLAQRRTEGRTADLRALEAAGFFFVLTNLPEDFTAAQVLDLYRVRWQVEMKFKMMKSIVGLDRLPVRDTELAQTYILTKLLAVLLIDQLIHQYESFSPWGYPLVTASKRVAA